MLNRVWNLPRIENLSLTDIDEKRPVTVVTSDPAWNAVKDKLHLTVVNQLYVTEASEEGWRSLPVNGEVLYAVGGGLAVDTAKYLARQHGLPLVCIPTALSVDAFLTWTSGIRHDGCVYYIETQPPDQLIIDFEVLGAAPASIRAAGICDVLSIATGLWDWRFADERGKNPPHMRYIPYVDQVARGILQGALDCTEAAGRGDAAGLKQLLNCLALEVQLCSLIGHSRPEEGSEHYFAYSVENAMGKGLPHGDLVGPGILLIAGIQGQDITPLKKALLACHVSLTNIPQDVILATLRDLPAYSRRHNLPYGIAHELTDDHLRRLPSLG
jgi:glycerol-1-phosphate dehydrogenase [NAD(P)+]